MTNNKEEKMKIKDKIFIIALFILLVSILFIALHYVVKLMNERYETEKNIICYNVKLSYSNKILNRLVEVRDQKQFCQNINCSNYFNNQESELTQQLNIIENATCAI